jgi:hypothetical protein
MSPLSQQQQQRVRAWAVAADVPVKACAHGVLRLELRPEQAVLAHALWRSFHAATDIVPCMGSTALSAAEVPQCEELAYRFVEQKAVGKVGEGLVLLLPRKKRVLAYVVGTLERCSGGFRREVVLTARAAVQVMIGRAERKREWKEIASAKGAQELLQSMVADGALLVPQFRTGGKLGPMEDVDEACEYVRYAGIWDLDARTEDVLAIATGKEPLMRGGEKCVYANGPAGVKKALALYYEETRTDSPNVSVRVSS